MVIQKFWQNVFKYHLPWNTLTIFLLSSLDFLYLGNLMPTLNILDFFFFKRLSPDLLASLTSEPSQGPRGQRRLGGGTARRLLGASQTPHSALNVGFLSSAPYPQLLFNPISGPDTSSASDSGPEPRGEQWDHEWLAGPGGGGGLGYGCCSVIPLAWASLPWPLPLQWPNDDVSISFWTVISPEVRDTVCYSAVVPGT